MELNEPGRQVVHFGVFVLDLKAGELRRAGFKVKLQEQPFQILRLLLEHAGEVVTHDKIIQLLWPNGTVVEYEHSVKTAVKKLRQALGDDAQTPRYVETVPRCGYRFIYPLGNPRHRLQPLPQGHLHTMPQQLPAQAVVDPLSGPLSSGDDHPTLPSARAKPEARDLLGIKVSHYLVLEIVGTGGMGVVYTAEDIKLGRLVALKFLPDELTDNPRALERFEREARSASTLNHPNICTIHEVEEHEGKPFIVMELLEGKTLKDRLENPSFRSPRGALLPIIELLDIAIQIAAGLEAAHKKSIIHRDIKPANIFITASGQVKILDFGLAKLTGNGSSPPPGDKGSGEPGKAPALPVHTPASSVRAGQLTRVGPAPGTAAYMSPEQIRGEGLDARTDLFSFGLVLYEMATRKPAFPGDTIAAVHEGILRRAAKPVRESNPGVPPKLEEIISKSLEKDRTLRYQTASDMGADLKRLKREMDSGRLVEGFSRSQAAIEGATTGVREAASQRRWPMWSAVSLAVVLVGLAVVWFLWRRRPQTSSQLTQRQITANPPEDWVIAGAISPDGKYVAYDDHTGLYIRSIHSGETHAISLPESFNDRLSNFEWFPGEMKLLADAASPRGFDLWVIAISGGDPHILYPGLQPAISPDGKRIAFMSGHYNTTKGIWIGGIDGESLRNLFTAEDNEYLSSPVWSPDGRWIAYARFQETEADSYRSSIEVRPVRGGPAKVLVSDTSLPEGSWICYLNSSGSCLTWSPDWRLVFSTRKAPAPSAQEDFALWEVPVNRRIGEAADKPKQLARWGGLGPRSPTITADGKCLSFLKTYSWQDVYLGELSPNGASMRRSRRFTLDDRGSDPNDWTRDSKAIILESTRNGRSEIFRQGVREPMPETIVQGPVDDKDAVLSPDGSWILYRETIDTRPGVPPSPERLMRRALAGGAPERVLEEPAGLSWDYHCPRRLGSPCILSQQQGSDLVFYSLDLLRGKGAALGKIQASPGLSGWNISPDGSRLAFVGGVGTYEGHIEVLSISNRAWHEVPVEPGWGVLQSIAWAADGNGFFVTSWLPDSFNLLNVSLTGKVNPLLRNTHRQSIYNPVPSPDGRYLAFDAETWDSNVWLLENF